MESQDIDETVPFRQTALRYLRFIAGICDEIADFIEDEGSDAIDVALEELEDAEHTTEQ